MIEDDTTWYLGTIGSGDNYKLAKYQDDTSNNLITDVAIAKVGLLRYGELMTTQFDNYANSINYWIITSLSNSNLNSVRYILQNGMCAATSSTSTIGVKPAMNLKSNVVITSGDGTKNNPFKIKLGS